LSKRRKSLVDDSKSEVEVTSEPSFHHRYSQLTDIIQKSQSKQNAKLRKPKRLVNMPIRMSLAERRKHHYPRLI
ncbi:hypothetical protein SERLA73DRAFT_135624, partial [Serpula lacrymans var. lacrymans S7.3]